MSSLSKVKDAPFDNETLNSVQFSHLITNSTVEPILSPLLVGEIILVFSLCNPYKV